MQKNEVSAIFFTSDSHKNNFLHCLEKFHNRNQEYISTCYIAAFPEIFKCFRLESQIHSPFEWYYNHLENNQNETQQATVSVAPLTGQTTALVHLALNLWNGQEFDLARGLSIWDSELYTVALQAINLRRHGRITIHEQI